MTEQKDILVTLGGECVETLFERKAVAPDRDGAFYLFRLKDLTNGRGERLVSVYRFGPKQLYSPDYDARIEVVRLNVLRRAFDRGTLSFEAPYDEHKYKEISLDGSDFDAQPPASAQEMRQFIMHKAYWIGFRFNPEPGHPIIFDTPCDAAYLGVPVAEVRRFLWLMSKQGLLEKTLLETGLGVPTVKLIEVYESKLNVQLPQERVFPAGTQYEAFKELKRILSSATRDIFIADNYLDESVLDMLQALAARPSVKLLTFKPTSDLRVAVRRFQSQYRSTVEVRLHQKEVHDRTIIIDDTHFYALGASIKDMGQRLSLLNKLEEPATIAKLRAEIAAVWASATPLA